MTTFVKDIKEIPNLKPPQETFVDDPTTLQEINLDDLIFDLQNGLKTIKNLHILHIIFIYSVSLKFIIKLQQYPELFEKFRSQQLKNLGLNDLSIDEEEEEEQIPGNDDDIKLKNDSLNNEIFNNSNTSITSLSTNTITGTSSSSDTTSATSSSSDLNITNKENTSRLNNEELLKTLQRDDFDDCNESLTEIRQFDNNFGEILINNKENISIFADDDIDDIKYNKTYDFNEDMKLKPDYIPIETLIKTTIIQTPEILEQENTKSEIIKLKKEIIHSTNSKSTNNYNHLVKIFNLIKLPNLSIQNFLLRINQYSSSISKVSYVHSLYLIFKLTIIQNLVKLTLNNCFRLVIASLRTTTKNLDDIYQKQKQFKNVVGLNLKDLLRCEIGFCYLINFNFGLTFAFEKNLKNFLNVEFVNLIQFFKIELNEYYIEVLNEFKN
ncbi:hypothetical protein KGF54_002658 [Candida jiufengensis]|uniref:uncharacterized protein n=1 Tax=Candida jiufengensis TaxID=497108 RepID=UPI002224F3B5|nr:uncharacterized protein KGF54_002658 [Candida jiufengensis]KAI5953287.1 hypothetical protein KGF54_002658 [Candida jiufengensis]